MTEAVWQFFMRFSGLWHEVFLGITAMVETLFPPFPGDVLYIALSGLGISRGIPVILLWIPGFIGCFISTLLLDSIGRSPSLEKVETLLIKTSGKRGYERAKRLLANHGSWIILFSRFIPGVRSILVVMAASSGMKRSSLLAYGSVSIAFWYALLVCAGTVLGSELSHAAGFMAELSSWLLIMSVSAVIAGAVIMLIRLKSGVK
jgi:membrane protein DedA with SNARE-associated domain